MVLWILSFVLAASLGAFLRYQLLLKFNIFWGTLLVNFLGSLFIGFLAIYLGKHFPQARIIVIVAFLGSLTTFSSYSFDLVKLFEEGFILKALLYAFLSNTLCFLGCYGGWKYAHLLMSEV